MLIVMPASKHGDVTKKEQIIVCWAVGVYLPGAPLTCKTATFTCITPLKSAGLISIHLPNGTNLSNTVDREPVPACKKRVSVKAGLWTGLWTEMNFGLK